MSNKINLFCDSFAEQMSFQKAFAFWKGRVAMYAILKALNIGPDDEVILPGYTCVMDVNPITYIRAKPVYVDIEPETFNIDVSLLKQKITNRTKIIIAQHTYGYPCLMDDIEDIAKNNNIKIIEDCCLALGSHYKGKMVGHFGTASYYSFQWNKPFTTGLGGMAVTNNNQLAKRIEEVISAEIIQPSNKEIFMLWAQLCVYRLFIYPRTTALAQNLFRFLTKKGLVVGSSSTAEFNPEKPKDFFKAMSSVQAGSGINQLEKLEKNIAHRKKIASLYDQLLKEKGFPARNYDPSIMDPVMVRYPVRITEKKKALQDAASAGVELGSWFESPLHPEETPLKPYGYIEGMCPHAEKACNQVVNLPLHPRVSEKTARHTVDFIAKYPKP